MNQSIIIVFDCHQAGVDSNAVQGISVGALIENFGRRPPEKNWAPTITAPAIIERISPLPRVAGGSIDGVQGANGSAGERPCLIAPPISPPEARPHNPRRAHFDPRISTRVQRRRA
jgi:hypothetical protein